MAKILVMGDLAPIGRAEASFCRGDADWFSAGLEPYWSAADYRVVNLECPLIQRATPINKVGPALGVAAESAAALSGFSLVGLANNHIMDHGPSGLAHTMHALDTLAIPSVGAGQSREQAGRPHVVEVNGVSVGFIAWAHHEFCIAGEASSGAFPIDLVDGLPVIEELRETCDFIVLLYHGGPEHFPYPTPTQRKTCRFLAERGVDVVICQHSHIVGASEKVGDSTILYGQGNYCFDLAGKETLSHWTTGLLCELVLEEGQAAEVNLIPLVHSQQDDAQPQLANSNKATEVLAEQEVLSKRLQDDAAYREVWESFARAQAEAFFYQQFPLGRIGRRLLRMLPIMKIPGAKQRILKSLNRLECEAHADPITAGLKCLARVED